jgi:hypothetical protein
VHRLRWPAAEEEKQGVSMGGKTIFMRHVFCDFCVKGWFCFGAVGFH